MNARHHVPGDGRDPHGTCCLSILWGSTEKSRPQPDDAYRQVNASEPVKLVREGDVRDRDEDRHAPAWLFADTYSGDVRVKACLTF